MNTHRNINLVHTDICPKGKNPSEEIPSNEIPSGESPWIDKNILRRSPRLAAKQSTVKRIKITMGDKIYVDHKYSESDDTNSYYSESESPIFSDITEESLEEKSIELSLSEINEEYSISESHDDSHDIDSILEIINSESKKRKHPDEDVEPSKKRKYAENYYEKKKKGLERLEFIDMKEELQNETWFQLLSREDKNIYTQKMLDINKPTFILPTVKDIIDLPLEKTYVKELIVNRNLLDTMDQDTSYDQACQDFIKKFEYYQNNETLSKISELTKSSNSMLHRIIDSKFNDQIKSLLYNKHLHYCYDNSDESMKYKKWIDTVLSLPMEPHPLKTSGFVPEGESKKNDSHDSLIITVKNMMHKLDDYIYGMKEVKEELICMVVNMINNPSSKMKAIGLSGPPGIGKTMLANIIADALNLPISRIAMGGITDSSFLEGHSFTYLGSEPGHIAKSVIKTGCTNGIIFFDEIDKIPKTSKGNEIEYALLHITDFTQNHEYRDRYMSEIPIDLSNCIFIYSMNNEKNIDSTLRSRIPIFHFDGYTKEEKVEIINRFLLPEILKNYNLRDVIINDKTARYLITRTHEEGSKNEKSGVRTLKNNLNKIISRINLYKWLTAGNQPMDLNLGFKINNFKLPFSISSELIDQILGEKKQDDYLSFYS